MNGYNQSFVGLLFALANFQFRSSEQENPLKGKANYYGDWMLIIFCYFIYFY